MTNNDVFNKLLHVTGIGMNKELVAHIFALGDPAIVATPSKVKGWRTAADDAHMRGTDMPDRMLEAFFAGLFEYRDQRRAAGHAIFDVPLKGL